jgi:fumarylacetoacetase
MDQTHNPALTSWVESANAPGADFPIQNLPFGIFKRRGATESPRGGVAIGDQILDLAAIGIKTGPTLNGLAGMGRPAWRRLRSQLSKGLSAEKPNKRFARYLLPMKQAELFLPVTIGDYTDFYSGIHHATNVGKILRPDNPLLPNYKWVPIGYHGRSSSISRSGTPVRRPKGQVKEPTADAPHFAPTRALDYEMEMGCFIGPGNSLGDAVPLDRAEEHLFGLCLVNDWSARDIQTWEYQPLGPFLAKNFATTISPWVVTMEALEPFRARAYERPAGDPAPLPYLNSASNRERGGIDAVVEVFIRTARMRAGGLEEQRVSRSRLVDLYWTVAQMFAHHTSNGCNLRPGDLFATGTISGPAKDARGCLLELTWRGAEPLTLPGGETRKFLEDGDEVIMRGYCERPGSIRIGFGECRGTVTSD